MMRHAYLLLVPIAATPLTAMAQPPAQGQATPQQERRICRSNQDNTGSILGGRRICRTAAEWERLSREAADNLQRVRESGARPVE